MKIDLNILKNELSTTYETLLKNVHSEDNKKYYYEIKNNVLNIEMWDDNTLDILITYDVNTMLFTMLWDNGTRIYQTNVLGYIVHTQRFFTRPIIKVTSKLRKV